ncbi:MAG: hypothetical protein V4597_08540 [Pseudomonadota bacterium]
MAVTITRTAWTDDDGSGTTGTVINNAVKTELYGQIDAALALLLPLAGGTLTGALAITGVGDLAGLTVTATGTNRGFVDYWNATGNLGQIWFDNAGGVVIRSKLGGNVDLFNASHTGAALMVSVQMGAPTGGDKGAGTINLAGDVYKNNTAYTNPDYVLEHWATGAIVKFAESVGAEAYPGLQPLAAVEASVRSRLALPRVADWRDGLAGSDGLFGGSDAILASVEEGYLYLFQHEARIAALEAELAGLRPH